MFPFAYSSETRKKFDQSRSRIIPDGQERSAGRGGGETWHGVEAGELVHALFGPNNQNELPSGLYSYAAGNTSVTASG